MSAKPTPGPYQIVLARTGDGFQVIDQNGMQVAWFWFGRGLLSYMTKEQAEANARAFVDRIEAIAKLERIRKIVGASSTESTANCAWVTLRKS